MEGTLGYNCITIIAGLLWFLALYHLCLLFALSFAWLSFADLNVINAIAEARNGFEIAFTVVQFITTITAALRAGEIVDSQVRANPYKQVRSYIQDGSNAMSNIRHRK
jgi:hypothetical protein